MEHLKKIPWEIQGSWMVLSRINDVKKELQDEARKLGLYFQDMRGNKSFDINQWKAICDWQTICDGGAITREDACNMYNYLFKHRSRLPVNGQQEVEFCSPESSI